MKNLILPLVLLTLPAISHAENDESLFQENMNMVSYLNEKNTESLIKKNESINDPNIKAVLSLRYLNGDGVDKNVKLARSLRDESLSGNSALVHAVLGQMALNRKDKKEALLEYKKSYELGYLPASITIYEILVQGKPKAVKDRNIDILLNAYNREPKLPFIPCYLAGVYGGEQGTSIDPIKEKKFLDICVSADVPLTKESRASSALLLANKYENGSRGYVKSIEKAQYYYDLSIEIGSRPDAYYYAGNMYFSGKNTKVDYFKAFDLFKEGAAHGDSLSSLMVGKMYLKGLGTLASLSNARTYFAKACEMKNQDGCTEYAKLNRYSAVEKNSTISNSSIGIHAYTVGGEIDADLLVERNSVKFTSNGRTISCRTSETSRKDDYIGTAFICEKNVQLILKKFNKTNNAYIYVMTDSFKKNVLTIPVNVDVSS